MIETLFANPWLKLVKRGRWIFASRKNHNEFVQLPADYVVPAYDRPFTIYVLADGSATKTYREFTGPGDHRVSDYAYPLFRTKELPKIDAINVLAWHVTPNEGFRMRLAIVEEFRMSVAGWELAMPAGLLEANETPVDCAKRELTEETGLIPNSIGVSSPIVLSSAGLTDESSVTVEIFCSGTPAQKPGVDNEQIKVHLLDQEGCATMLARAQRGEVFLSARLWPILMSLATTGRFGGVTISRWASPTKNP